MNKNDNDYSKLRELLFLEGVILALKNQMNTAYNELSKVRDKQYSFDDATDKEKQVMKRIDDFMNEIEHIWNYKML